MPNIRDIAQVRVRNFEASRRTRRRSQPRTTASPLVVERVNEAALEAALTLAGGDTSRLRFLPDGSVLVANTSRAA